MRFNVDYSDHAAQTAMIASSCENNIGGEPKFYECSCQYRNLSLSTLLKYVIVAFLIKYRDWICQNSSYVSQLDSSVHISFCSVNLISGHLVTAPSLFFSQ